MTYLNAPSGSPVASVDLVLKSSTVRSHNRREKEENLLGLGLAVQERGRIIAKIGNESRFERSKPVNWSATKGMMIKVKELLEVRLIGRDESVLLVAKKPRDVAAVAFSLQTWFSAR